MFSIWSVYLMIFIDILVAKIMLVSVHLVTHVSLSLWLEIMNLNLLTCCVWFAMSLCYLMTMNYVVVAIQNLYCCDGWMTLACAHVHRVNSANSVMFMKPSYTLSLRNCVLGSLCCLLWFILALVCNLDPPQYYVILKLSRPEIQLVKMAPNPNPLGKPINNNPIQWELLINGMII